MKTYLCSAGIHGSRYLGQVQAESAEQALESAWELDEGGSLCHQCSDLCEDPEIVRIHVRAEDDEDDFAEWPAPVPAQDEERVQLARRLLELLERATAEYLGVTIWRGEQFHVGVGMATEESVADTLAEAVEAALEEIGGGS